jgi:hypothetical protein
MRISAKTKYNRYSETKLPFLTKTGDKIMNGHWDVSETKEFLEGIRTGEEEIRLKDYLVYRPLPKAITALRDKPDVHPQSYDMQLYYKKIDKVMREGIYIGSEYYNPMFCFWHILFIFEIPMYDKNNNPIEGSEIGRPLYSTIDRYIFDLLWKGFKQKKYGSIMGGRGIGKSFITDSVVAWFYMIFDNQEIIISATSDPIVEEAWDKVEDTIKLIEEEYPGYRQKQMTSSTKKIVAGEEYYDSNNDKKVRGSQNEIRKITYADNPNVTRGRRPHFQHIEEFASFPSHPSKGSLKNCLTQSKGSWKIMGSIMKAFVMMTGTGGSVNNKDAEDVFTNPDGFNLLKVMEWTDNPKGTGIFIPAYLKYGGTWEGVGTPNIELAMLLLIKSRKALESDPIAFIGELQEFPITLDEVFTVTGTNIFNQDKIAEQLTKLKVATKKPWKTGQLNYILDKDGNVLGVEFVEKAGGKIIIVEEPDREPDGQIMNNLYVGGVDSIDQGRKDSLVDGSKLAVAIKKRMTNSLFTRTSQIYVAFYNERSDDVRWDYENVLKLSMYFNAKMNIEYTKINIVSFFREKKQLWRVLKRPSIAIGSNVSGQKASTLIGTPATTAVIDHQDQKFADYIDDNYYQILYIPVLEQCRDYSRENRTKYDFVVACGLAELADEDFLGRPASTTGTASGELTMIGMYRDGNGRKRWGTIPVNDSKEINSISEEEIGENNQSTPFKWIDPTQ